MGEILDYYKNMFYKYPTILPKRKTYIYGLTLLIFINMIMFFTILLFGIISYINIAVCLLCLYALSKVNKKCPKVKNVKE